LTSGAWQVIQTIEGERSIEMHRCLKGCGRWTDRGNYCTFCSRPIGWEPRQIDNKPVDVYVEEQLGWQDMKDDVEEASKA